MRLWPVQGADRSRIGSFVCRCKPSGRARRLSRTHSTRPSKAEHPYQPVSARRVPYFSAGANAPRTSALLSRDATEYPEVKAQQNPAIARFKSGGEGVFAGLEGGGRPFPFWRRNAPPPGNVC